MDSAFHLFQFNPGVDGMSLAFAASYEASWILILFEKKKLIIYENEPLQKDPPLACFHWLFLAGGSSILAFCRAAVAPVRIGAGL